MIVRLTTSRAGFGWLQREGEVVDLPPREASALLAAGQAERVEPIREAAVVTPPRAAVHPPPRPRSRKE